MGNGTELGRVRGLGAAHHGSHHWLLQRFTAIGNLVLGTFLAASFALLPDYAYGTVRDWIAQPLPAIAVALFAVSAFWHARLGLQVLVEDYVHTPGNKFAAIALLNLAAFAGAATVIVFVARIVFAAAGAEAAAGEMQSALHAAQGAR